MRARAQFTDPTDMPVTITLTGTLGEFENLSNAIGSAKIPHYQTSALTEQIRKVSWALRNKVDNSEDPS